MKKALLVLATVAMGASALAQGTIVFAIRNIDNAAGTGTYNAPIWQDGHLNQAGFGAGTLAGGVTVGLFTPGSTSPLLNTSGTPATTLMRTDANAQLFQTASQTAVVPTIAPGQTGPLEVRAWQGTSLANAQSTAGQQWNVWTFTSKPLGGTPPGGLPITPPTMTGFGPESGVGQTLQTTPEPSTIALGAIGIGALLLRRRSK